MLFREFVSLEKVEDVGRKIHVTASLGSGQKINIPRQSRGLYIVSPSKGQESEPPEGGYLPPQQVAEPK